jgi:3-methylcrotonyl-CoA carboxylase alpha subunit
MMERRFRRGDEILEVSGRREGARVVLSAPDGEHAFAWEELDPGEYLLRQNGRQHRCVVARAGDERWLWIAGHIHHLKLESDTRKRVAAPLGELVSPMPGQVLQVLVAPGQRVAKDQPLLVLEAMKMQYEIVAPRDGIVARVHAAEGTQVEGGVGLVTLEPAPGEIGTERKS